MNQMKKLLDKSLSRLPLDMVYSILEYAGKMKCRNGKYMYQIPQDDNRYVILQQMARIIPTVIGGWRITIDGILSYEPKHVHCNKYTCTYMNSKPLIVSKISEKTSYYKFSCEGYCYDWTIYYFTQDGRLRSVNKKMTI
jgi:hypothetical protein